MKKLIALFILAGLIPACTFAEITAPAGGDTSALATTNDLAALDTAYKAADSNKLNIVGGTASNLTATGVTCLSDVTISKTLQMYGSLDVYSQLTLVGVGVATTNDLTALDAAKVNVTNGVFQSTWTVRYTDTNSVVKLKTYSINPTNGMTQATTVNE